jgi:hypothetical protein
MYLREISKFQLITGNISVNRDEIINKLKIDTTSAIFIDIFNHSVSKLEKKLIKYGNIIII